MALTVSKAEHMLTTWVFVHIPKQASNDEQDVDSLDHIVGLKPANALLNVRPDLPAHDKGDDEATELHGVSLVGDMLAIVMDDAHCPRYEAVLKVSRKCTSQDGGSH